MPYQSQDLMRKYKFPKQSTLLDICEAVHEHVAHYGDPLPQKKLDQCIEILEIALVHWTPCKLRQHERFDCAVQDLIEATYHEHMVWNGKNNEPCVPSNTI